ncbi:hypothetical protein FHW20_000513 [Ochrobactrum intermedium]|uniref:Uncharacterized protein n=1 Tax=Brucella intermedia TaxID=94625 RepID=A0ABR6AJH2_9HYPH|nr:hypothetical protein [Brucella intermedia]NYD81355.1 hypothetical protein [Brucella intermedia]
MKINHLAVTLDSEIQRVPGSPGYDALHIGKSGNLFAVDADEAISSLKPGLSRWTARLDTRDKRIRNLTAVKREEHTENDDSQNNIESRSGKDRRRTLPNRLGVKRPSLLIHTQTRIIDVHRRTRGALIANELDVAAKRNGGNLPSRSVFIRETDQLGPKTDGKSLGADAAPARNQIVAHFMDKDHNGQHKQKRNDGPDKQAFATQKKGQRVLQITAPYKTLPDRQKTE